MSAFPGSPRVISGGIVLVDPGSGSVLQTIGFQYNPETLTRTLKAEAVGPESGDRLEATRLKGAPVETIKLDAELDATDQLENPAQNPEVVQYGLHPQLAMLEMITYPSSSSVQDNIDLAAIGTIEIVPMESALALFVWSAVRIVPVRLTDLTVTEQAFDPNLNPILAKVSLTMQVLNVNDLGVGAWGSSVFMAYHQRKEQLAALGPSTPLAALGITRIL